MLKDEFNQEKNAIKNIQEASLHRIKRDAWLMKKRVLDTIQKDIEVAPDKSKTLTIPLSSFVWIHHLGENCRNLFITLDNFKKKGLLSYKFTKSKSKNVVSENQYFKITIPNLKGFQNYHIAITKLQNYIQKDGESRFPNVYGSPISKIDDRRYLMSKNSEGDYFYKDKRIEANKTAIYYQIFDILYTHCDQNGFLSYGSIENHLIKRNFPESENEQKRNKRINNAIFNEQQGLFRFAKINNKKFNNRTPDGKKLIELVRGKGLKFNYTKI